MLESEKEVAHEAGQDRVSHQVSGGARFAHVAGSIGHGAVRLDAIVYKEHHGATRVSLVAANVAVSSVSIKTSEPFKDTRFEICSQVTEDTAE